MGKPVAKKSAAKKSAAKKSVKAGAKPPKKSSRPKSTKPSLAAPPPPPPPPPTRDELEAPRDIARLTRYGERFGAHKIDVRMIAQQLPVADAIAIADPGAPKSWRVFDRPVGAGQFRVMVSVARTEGSNAPERLAAIVVHVGRPPIAKWTVAHYRGQKRPKSADQLPRCEVTTGWLAIVDAAKSSPGVIAVPAEATTVQPATIPLTDGRVALAVACKNGEYAAYWAVDAADKPICLVIDFDIFTQKDWKTTSKS